MIIRYFIFSTAFEVTVESHVNTSIESNLTFSFFIKTDFLDRKVIMNEI